MTNLLPSESSASKLSFAGRLCNRAVRFGFRRRHWGDEWQLARRARRLVGIPPGLRWFWGKTGEREWRTDGVPGERIAPADRRPGALMYIHGGGYVSGSPGSHRPITTGFARRTRREVFAPDYRLAPEHRCPAALDDCVAAYQQLLARGFASDDVVLAGESAGGGLVVATMVRLRDRGLPLPARAICFSPWTDLSGSTGSLQTMDGRCHMFFKENIPDFAAIYLGNLDPRNPEASPLFADLHGLPPVLIQVGSTEVLLDDSLLLHEALMEAGVDSRLQVYDDIFHGWQCADGLVPEATAAMDEAAAFAFPEDITGRV